MSGLTSKQILFVEAYLQCWNATEAARRAGYQGNENTLGSVGWENMQKPAIRERISQRLQASAMSADEALMRFAAEARASIGDYIDEFGNFDWAAIKRDGYLFKEISHTKGKSSTIKMYDSQAARTQILKAHSAFVQKVEVKIDDIGDTARIDRITKLFDAARERRDQSTSS